MRGTTPLRTSAAPAGSPPPRPDGNALSLRLLDILASAEDLSSWSDGLSMRVEHWIDDFHLSPRRANLLRGLSLGSPASVLEIGASGGALTRYLGEISPLVDALEPDPAMAAVAVARCASLPHVTVHPIGLADVPAEPAYDLIVATDVPTVDGTAREALAELLSTCRRLLRPGGRIVVALDNVAGARRRAGGGSPVTRADGSAPLVASRDDLEDAAASAGLDARVLGAFPDHRHTTCLIDHRTLRAVDARLLDRLVKLPSPPYDDDTTDGVLEQAAWSDAVAAGDDDVCANSLVLLTGDDTASPDAATYWSAGRRADLSACNRIRPTAEGAVVVRDRAHPLAPRLDGPLRLRPHTEPYVSGAPLIELLASTTRPDEAVPLLTTWLDLVAASAVDAHVPWDLIPRNVQLDESGVAHAIDQEWEHDHADFSSTLLRGAFWTAYDLLFVTATPAWLSGHTVLSAADVLVALSGHEVPARWNDALDAEAASMACVAPRSARDSLAAKTRKERRNLSYLSQQSAPGDTGPADPVVDALSVANRELRDRVEQLELARRHDDMVARDHAIGLRAKLEHARVELSAAEEKLRRTGRKVERLQKEIAAIRSSTTWRVGSTLIRPVARVKKRRDA